MSTELAYRGGVERNSFVKKVTLSLDTNAYADGDLLAATQVIPNFFPAPGVDLTLSSIQVLDEDDQGAAMDILLLNANEDLGTENSAYAMSDTEARSVVATIRIAATDWVDWGGQRIVEIGGLGLVLKAPLDSRNLFIAAISRGSPTHTANGIKVSLGVGEGGAGGIGTKGTAGNPIVVQGLSGGVASAVNLTQTNSNALVNDDAAAGTTAPVPVGGIYRATLPTYTDLDRTQLHGGQSGSLNIQILDADGSQGAGVVTSGADAVNNGLNALRTVGFVSHYNGTSWDRARGNENGTAFVSGARTATPTPFDGTNYNARGLHLVIDVTASAATPSVVFTIQGKDALSGKFYTILTSAAITGTGTTVLRVYPALTAIANTVATDILPRSWRLIATHDDADSITYSVGYSLIL